MTVLSRLILRYRTASSVRSFCTKSSENDLTRAATAAALSSALPVKNSNGRGRNVQWVFLGCPGVGKGTYAARLSNLLGVPHISTGDLLAEIVNQGKLISDEIIINLLSKHLEESQAKGEMGFILDGFPRTVRQAEILDGVTDIDLVINLKLRKEALIAKCLGRRICSECGGNYNVASIDIKGEDGSPRMYMPPLLPPPNCESKLITRSDDTEVVVKERLLVYNEKIKDLSPPCITFQIIFD